MSQAIPAISSSSDALAESYNWRALGILALYRVVIVGCIALLFVSARNTPYLVTARPGFFFATVLAYLGLALLAYAVVRLRRPSFRWQIYCQMLLDISAIGSLIMASGTLGNGLGALMVVAIAGGSILMRARMAILFAALATLLLLGQQVYTHLVTGAPGVGYSQVGFLGITIFATALLGSLLARRARENQALAERRGEDLAGLEALNAHIVQQLDAGVIAVNPADEVRLINKSAWKLLERPPRTHRMPLHSLSPALAGALEDWRERRGDQTVLTLTELGHEVRPQFLGLGPEARQGVLILLEDLASLRARVQQEKLVSLGRLTAGIAHEIRNPLSAMNHAAQLLQESPHLDEDDQRLVQIVRKQGQRLNAVVENVLQLSRRQPPQQSVLALREWLQEFAQEFRLQPQHVRIGIEVDVQPASLCASFDALQLHQVLGNLCANAVRHSGQGEATRIFLHAFIDGDGKPALEISDNGKGIDAETAEQLFEPFYTTAHSGTGLGLYLCRELCESNHARLFLANRDGACFRLSFAGPREENQE